MNRIIVTGQGTDVGKTVVACIVATILKADYWKPVECGAESDSKTVQQLLRRDVVHPPHYSLMAPLSPHAAAKLEGISLDFEAISPPKTERPLVMETAGGIFVPITTTTLVIDLFSKWNASWIIVSKHYLGSINHTLLTWQALQLRNVPILGVIFNGEPNPDSEEAILAISKMPFLARLLPEQSVNRVMIQRYAQEWKSAFSHL